MDNFDYSIDIPIIKKYNERKKAGSEWIIQTHMTPAPYDGDPFSAKVVLLMNNPGYGYGNSVPEDHTLKIPGWPLVGLSEMARPEFRDWYKRPFGYLIDQFGALFVSNNVAIIQINPWASESFDISLVLPSRQHQVAIAKQALNRGALLIAGRSHKFWRESLGDKIYYARNPRNPTLSEGGLPVEAFELLIKALKSSGISK
jgi:hypothetical protein